MNQCKNKSVDALETLPAVRHSIRSQPMLCESDDKAFGNVLTTTISEDDDWQWYSVVSVDEVNVNEILQAFVDRLTNGWFYYRWEKIIVADHDLVVLERPTKTNGFTRLYFKSFRKNEDPSSLLPSLVIAEQRSANGMTQEPWFNIGEFYRIEVVDGQSLIRERGINLANCPSLDI